MKSTDVHSASMAWKFESMIEEIIPRLESYHTGLFCLTSSKTDNHVGKDFLHKPLMKVVRASLTSSRSSLIPTTLANL
jgi:hypothetical protein